MIRRLACVAALALLAGLPSCGDDDDPGSGDAACNPALSVDPCLAEVVIAISQCIDGAGSCTWSEVAGPPRTRHLLEWSNGARDEIEFDGAQFVTQRYTSSTGKICETTRISEADCHGLRWTPEGRTIALCAEDNGDAGGPGTTVYRCADGTRHVLPVADAVAITRACSSPWQNTGGGAPAPCVDAEGNPYTGMPTLPMMTP